MISYVFWHRAREGVATQAYERAAEPDLLADGMDRDASLWRRQLALGPGPEHCLLSDAQAPGAAAKRLPHGWETSVLGREVLFDR